MPKNQPANKQKTLTQERNVLSRLSHPFICNLKYAFQDSRYLYMVVDLERGGDLRYYLKHYTLTENAIRLIIAELGCAIDYLHDQGIVHRDVKPENIMLDGEGHVHLGDFNVATQLSCDAPVIRGVSGTFSYLAPEMQEGAAYTELVDWWALGVVFYECVYGRVPFRVRDRDQNKMLKLMTRGVEYPKIDNPVSHACVEAMKRFLVIYPHGRIRDGYDMFKLEFFAEYTRDEVESGVDAVFVPPIERFDFSNKVDRKKILVNELVTWKQKGSKRLPREKLVSRYRRQLRRLSTAALHNLLKPSNETETELNHKLDFVCFNHNEVDELGDIKGFGTARQDSMILPSSVTHPSRLKKIRASKLATIPQGVVSLGQAGKSARMVIKN